MSETKGGSPGRVLSYLFANGPTTRAALARGLGLTRPSIGALVGSLVDAGLLVEDSERVTLGRGRPGQVVRLRPDAGHFVGIEIGVERLVVAILDLSGAVRARVEQRGSLVGLDPDAVFRRLTGLVDMARGGGGAGAGAGGIGVSVPGFMTRDGVVLSAPLLGWRNVDVASGLRRHFDGPIMVENDANATAHGEWHFVPDHRGGDLLAVLLANGIGCGLVADGRILRGTHGLAGELGHMPMAVAPDDDTNWEARAGLLAGRSGVMPDDWPLWLARGLATAIYAYDPETIVVGGELTSLFLAHRPTVEAHLRRLLVPGFPVPTLAAAKFGADGCAIGAASLLHARFLEQTAA